MTTKRSKTKPESHPIRNVDFVPNSSQSIPRSSSPLNNLGVRSDEGKKSSTKVDEDNEERNDPEGLTIGQMENDHAKGKSKRRIKKPEHWDSIHSNDRSMHQSHKPASRMDRSISRPRPWAPSDETLSTLSTDSSTSPWVTPNGFDHQTAATSLAVTPAESGMETGRELARRSSERLLSAQSLHNPYLPESSPVLGKRKHQIHETSANRKAINQDDALARALQEEEFTKDENSVPKRSIVSVHDELRNLDSFMGADPRPSKRRKNRSLRGGRTSQSTAVTIPAVLDHAAQLEVDSENFSFSDSETATDDEGNAQTSFAVHIESELERRRRLDIAKMRARGKRERDRLEMAHPEITQIWTTLEAMPAIIPQRAAQPTNITRQLKPFQLEGLDWMLKQEKSQWKGGLLGDEMGMGKTIQAVSLIMSDFPAKGPTLVIVPPVALMQWQSEINAYTDGKLKVLVHHGTNPKVKNLGVKELKQYNVIMISYAGLESLHRKESKGWIRGDVLVKENSKIHALKYHRLILDEAHNIKTRNASVAKACYALQAEYRWCLSGTPVQNRIGEFFSLMRFLQVKPLACYACKICDCLELHWSQGTNMKCLHCNHSGFSHISIFNQELLVPITVGGPELRTEALGKLRLITDRIMLRRMKRDHSASMELPPKEVIIHNEFFAEIERDFSTSVITNTTCTFDTYVSRGVMLNHYANIFGLIMKMRQVANHPDLILKKHADGGQNILVCSICDETAEEPIRSQCHHEFCRKCARDYVQSFDTESSGPECPRCHLSLSIDFDQADIEQDENEVKKSSIINRIKMEGWTSSTKIEMLVYDLYKLRSSKQTHKSIVFSQFTSMLQLVEWRLRRAGFNTVMLDGSMSPAQRQLSIEYFMTNVDVEVFLVSLKAGGVALNLTEASRVFILDPWWNPAAEWQSADRCHRIGQKRPCVITRLCIEDSVESRMVLLQEKKTNMINGTINNDRVAMDKLTPEDMQFLFRGS